MRPVDEIIERPVAASTTTTGSVRTSTQLPPPRSPSPHPDKPAPFTPWLPSAAPMTARPITTTVAALPQDPDNPLTAAQRFHAAALAAGKTPLLASPNQRRGRRLLKLLMVLGVLLPR